MAAMTADKRPLMVEVINRHQQMWPVDLDGIARDLGIAVKYDRSLPDTISGKISRSRIWGGPSGYLITVNANHHPNRQRFTLGHEIAHFMMHRDEIGDGIVDNEMYRSEGLNDHMERMADRQAAEIILPAPLVLKAYKTHSKSIIVLARAFEVSEAAMRIRLKELRVGP
jgi:hypothetical protein